MKNISASQFASIKRIYMNVSPLIVKKNKLISKINELTVEIAQINDEIAGNEMGVKALTGGYSSEQLVIRTVENTGKVNSNGSAIKSTKYSPNPEYITWNEETKKYELKELVEEAPEDIKDVEDSSTVNIEPTDIEPVEMESL